MNPLLTLGLGPSATLASFLLVGLVPPAVVVEEDCTQLVGYDFTAASAPFYPVSEQPGYWHTDVWTPPSGKPAPTAGFPNLIIAFGAEIVGGELTYLDDNPRQAGGIFGTAVGNIGQVSSYVDTYGGLTKIYAEVGVNFHDTVFETILPEPARILTVHPLTTFYESFTLLCEDDDGPPTGTVVFTLRWCNGNGTTAEATVATKARTFADGLHTFRVEMTPSTPVVPGSTINPNLLANGVARVYIDDVLEYENTAIQFRTNPAPISNINDTFDIGAVGLGYRGFVGGYTYLDFGYCTVVEEPDPEEPPIPGGETPETEEPTVSTFPTGITRLFGLLTYGSGSPFSQIAVAETTFSFEPSTWFGGMKHDWLITLESYTRKFSDNIQGVDVRVVLGDPLGVFRALASTTRLSGAIWEHFLVSDTVRYALGEPHRRFAGRIRTHRALDGWKYELIVRDLLSDDMARLADAPLIPPAKITPETFPAATKEYQDRAVPIALGLVSDESEDNPQGVAPPLIVAPSVNLSYFGGINVEAVPAIISHGAIPSAGLIGYYNTISNPYTRVRIPESAWGTILTAPGKPGWEFTGLPNDWADYPQPDGPTTQRYTPVFFLASDPNVQAFVDGRIQVAFNLVGRTEFGDGTGRYISDAPDAFDFLVTNYMKPPYYRFGDHNDPPVMFRGYPVVNGAGIIRTRDRLRSFLGTSPSEYPIGFLVAGNGKQQTLRHWLKELCQGVLMEVGPNRHGQALLDVEDVNAAAEFTMSDIFDIENGSFSVTVDHESYADNADYKFGERYLPAVAPLPAPPEGEVLPPVNVGPHSEWVSIGTHRHDDAITAAGDRGPSPPLQLENRVVRNSDVAVNWIQRVLDRAVGPGPAYQGQWLVELTTSWQALDVELGSVVAIDHIEGFGTGGFVGRRFRVLEITDDLQNCRITLKGRILIGEGSPA